MTRPNSRRKTRSDKFPLTLHKTGQYCKKIKGKFYYFGSDKEQAMRRYLEQVTYLHTAKGERPRLTQNPILLEDVPISVEG
jgi:YHS domain-containing protein